MTLIFLPEAVVNRSVIVTAHALAVAFSVKGFALVIALKGFVVEEKVNNVEFASYLFKKLLLMGLQLKGNVSHIVMEGALKIILQRTVNKRNNIGLNLKLFNALCNKLCRADIFEIYAEKVFGQLTAVNLFILSESCHNLLHYGFTCKKAFADKENYTAAMRTCNFFKNLVVPLISGGKVLVIPEAHT